MKCFILFTFGTFLMVLQSFGIRSVVMGASWPCLHQGWATEYNELWLTIWCKQRQCDKAWCRLWDSKWEEEKKKKSMTEIAAKMVHGWFDWWPVWHLSSKRYWGLKGRGRRILLSRHLILHWSKRCISSRLNYANSQLGPAPVTVTVCGCVCVGVWSFS